MLRLLYSSENLAPVPGNYTILFINSKNTPNFIIVWGVFIFYGIIEKNYLGKRKMKNSQIAYQLQVLFEKKITKYYHNSYKGLFGKVQIEVLDYLYENHEGRTQDVADALLIPKQHASKIILRFVELGLIDSKPDPLDKRATIFSLSAKGLKLIEEHIEDSNEHFESLIKNLDEQDEVVLMQSMKKIVEILEKL